MASYGDSVLPLSGHHKTLLLGCFTLGGLKQAALQGGVQLRGSSPPLPYKTTRCAQHEKGNTSWEGALEGYKLTHSRKFPHWQRLHSQCSSTSLLTTKHISYSFQVNSLTGHWITGHTATTGHTVFTNKPGQPTWCTGCRAD